ncbi:hypothetical protein [Saccharothrix coeruleofusca]|uniref:Guanylate cyclase domain-containing protein n=1 Tax=Saccharothrix coeruleofusca TaxID=33919 RepID=A0A918EBU1_9PSEU|nr:hypothetical protein [Saccharothrix coeruleofusca]GGP44786.1 hypothetical protein GCM10010185_15660 [Saccharothrix coeruleofusca]
MGLEPISRAVLVVDVEKSSERHDREKVELREALYQVLHSGLEAAGLPAERYRLDDLGDGVLAVVDSEVLPLLDPLLEVAVDGLARFNARRDPVSWLRLRFGVHFGLIARDAHGWVGDDVTTAFRIVNGEGVKSVLRAAARAQSVVVVSDAVYRSVVRPGYRGLRAASYRQIHDGGRQVWVRVPGYAEPPVPAEDARPPAPVAAEQAAKSISISTANGNVFAADTIGHVDARTGLGGAP